MDIYRIHYFCTVLQTGSLVRASELLGVSQPALSKSIKTLEGELGKKLTIPSGRGIAFTDYGKAFAEEARPLIEQLFGLKTSLLIDKKQPRLSFATFEVFSTYFLGKLVSDVFSELEVSITELIPGPMEAAISKGHADIGITYLPVPRPDLDVLKVGSIEMGIYGIEKKYSQVEFAVMPFVIPNGQVSGTPSKVRGLDGWPDDSFPRNIKYEVSMMQTALELCRRGICVGYFPKFVIELYNETVLPKYRLNILKEPTDFKFQNQDVFLIKRKSHSEDSNFKKVARALRTLR